MKTSGNRIEFEGFVNRPSGLEHGNTPMGAPSGRTRGRPLRLEMTLDGDLDCRVTCDGRHVTLHDESGAEILGYEKVTLTVGSDGDPVMVDLSGKGR